MLKPRPSRPREPFTARDTQMYYPHLCIAIGILLFAYSFYSENEHKTSMETSVEVMVRVVEVERKSDDGKTRYRPVFEVTLDDGSQKRYAGNTWISPQPHETGDVVPGRYAPETGWISSNQMIEVEENSHDFLKYGGVWAVFFGICVFVYRRLRKK